MQRSVLAVVAALLMLMLSVCGAGDDAPTVSNEAPFVGEKFTISGAVDADGARPVMLQSYDDESCPHGVSAAVVKLGGADSYDLGKQVAANDRAVWKSFGGRYHAKASTYPGELAFLRNWFAQRYAWMDKELMKAPPPLP